MLQCLVSTDSLPFPLVGPILKLHRKRDNVVVSSAVISRPDDLLPAHGTFGGAFSGLGALVFASDQGFHETCMAEEVTLKKEGQT